MFPTWLMILVLAMTLSANILLVRATMALDTVTETPNPFLDMLPRIWSGLCSWQP